MIEEINEILYYMRNDDLRSQAKILGLKSSGTNNDLTERILQFYKKENFVVNTYKELNAYEKEYLDNLVKQSYTPTKESVEAIDLKYKESKLSLEKVNYFYINNRIPKCFKEKLNELIPPYEINFTDTVDNIDFNDHWAYLAIEDKIVKYIDEFIKYINEKNIKITSKKGLLSKKNCVEFVHKNNIEEVTKDEENLTIDDIRSINDTVVIKGIFNLLIANKVIDNKKEVFCLGKNYKEYIKLNKLEKIRYLLNGYLESDIINEIDEMDSGIYSYEYINFSKPRKFILEIIKKLPIDKWVSMENFFNEIRKKDVRFIRKAVGKVLKKSDYDNWYYDCGYMEFDLPFVDVCLINYFAVMGIIDVVIDIEYDDYDFRRYLASSYIKLTDFGAQILKLVATKEESNTQELLIVNNDKVIMADNSSTLEYQLFFDRFASSIKENNFIIYDLSFKSFAKAIDLGIDLEELMNYLQANSNNISKELLENYNYYKKIINKIKIKKVTIIEYPKELEKQILSSNLSKYISKNQKEHIIIQDKKSQDVKKALENNYLFCSIDD